MQFFYFWALLVLIQLSFPDDQNCSKNGQLTGVHICNAARTWLRHTWDKDAVSVNIQSHSIYASTPSSQNLAFNHSNLLKFRSKTKQPIWTTSLIQTPYSQSVIHNCSNFTRLFLTALCKPMIFILKDKCSRWMRFQFVHNILFRIGR